MTLQKTRHIYKAVAKAIDAWGDRCHINARAHLGKTLGFRGENAGIQLSNTLNSSTYNPTSPKRLSIDHLDALLQEVDAPAQEKILSAIIEPYGYTLCKAGKKEPKAFDMVELFTTILKLDKHHGNISAAVGDAMEDMEIDAEESENIKELIAEFRTLLRGFESLIVDAAVKGGE